MWRLLIVFVYLVLVACGSEPSSSTLYQQSDGTLQEIDPDTINGRACPGEAYPDPQTSPYDLPYPVDSRFKTGLTNCSSSYHSQGQPDQYAYDFNMPEGTEFVAARAGVVSYIVEDQNSAGGGGGNFVVIDHGDNTFGMYLHSPRDGIWVEVGDTVVQGQVLGISGRSGLAGYPHLHFIVVYNSSAWPYEGAAISFRNAIPQHRNLLSHYEYTAGP